jgi:hypothetical protein
MKINDLLGNRIVRSYLKEDWMSDDLLNITYEDNILFEMANLKSDITDLPPNIQLCTRPETNHDLPHSEYRIKVYKDHKHTVTYLVGSNPIITLQCKVSKKFRLDAYEKKEIEKFIKAFYPLIITFIDGKLSVDDLELEIQKVNRMR